MANPNDPRFWKPTEEILAQIEQYASQGLTQEQIAYNVGITPQTFSLKKHDFPELDSAIKKGKAQGMQIVTNKLFEKIKGGNLIAMIFFLKCNGWKEVQISETNLTLSEDRVNELRKYATNEAA